MLTFIDNETNNPKLTQKQISKQLGFWNSTIKRYRFDIQMDCRLRRNHWGKKKKSSTSITQTHTSSENTKSIKNTKNNKKNDLKGGFVLQSDHQEDKTKFN